MKPVIAIIADELTRQSLAIESKIINISPITYKWDLLFRKPDLLFVESAWKGVRDSWKYKIASYPEHPKRNNSSLEKVVRYAQDLGIPTVFWNKEDCVHFERFIESAKLFDYVFTVDSNVLQRYKEVLLPDTPVNTLMFSVQPQSHFFSGFDFKYIRTNFVGSYSWHIHSQRRIWQDMLFNSAQELGVTVFDRNSNRKSRNYRYPVFDNLIVKSSVSNANTAKIYKEYLVSLNVNTIEDSPTMFSRRLVEILACGGIAVTTPALSVEKLFKEYCHVVSTPEEMQELFSRLRHGPSSDDLEKARAGAEYVEKNHTWSHRLNEVLQVIGLS